jgi:hypothetical protein
MQEAGPEPRAPLNVVLADPRNSLFQDIHDPRLSISTLAEAGPDAPDVLVLNANSLKRLRQSVAAVPDTIWRHVRASQARLVLDASGEGFLHDPVRTVAVHEVLRAMDVDPGRAAFVTQDRAYGADYGDWCDAQGLGDRRMAVWIYDRFIQMAFAPFHETGEAQFEQRLARSARAGRARSRRYVCFNNLMRPVRIAFLLRLLEQGLWDKGFVSMGPIGRAGQGRISKEAFLSSMGSWDREGAPSEKILALLDELYPFLDELLAREPGPIGVDTSKSENQQWEARIRASEIQECADSWFTIATETDFYDRLHRITEKPFKPLVNFHPLIVLGSVGSLRLIRAYGFDTFPGVFDERYDEEPDPRARFDMVFDEAARLCRMDETEIGSLDEAAAPVLVFNAWWGLVELPKLFRSRIGAALVDRLMSHCGFGAG